MKQLKYYIVAAALLLCGANAKAQNIALSTNVAGYAFLGTMNMEASYGVAQHWSLNAGVKYNPFTFGQEETRIQARQQTYALGARFWPWHIYSGWWVAGKVQYQEYNVGTYKTENTSEGDRYGSGLTGGYTYMLNPHLNLEFGLGVWAGYDNYVRYECPRCGRIVEEGSGFFVLPNDLILSVSYVF